MIAEFRGYALVRREPRGPKGCRLDFHLSNGRIQQFVEVKSATVAEGSCAQFPDSLSPRSVKHLTELTRVALAGDKAALVFVSQRGDVSAFKVNRGFDPEFTKAYDLAVSAGVKIIAIKHTVCRKGLGVPTPLPISDE